MNWDFWNAVLFAGTICTTIGYGHIYPMTDEGRLLTMIFALFGIPLMLLVLQDFGKLLTITMKFPWFQTKRLMRRVLRCCTKQPVDEMKEIEKQERHDLDIFDLPLPVGIALIVIWIFVCSFVLSVWDHNWTLFESFYFFFTSLSTVGLGDLVPSSPRLLITMFGFILVGLSLVSMVINLLQTKMKSTYDAGHHKEVTHSQPISLGVLQCYSSDEEKRADVSERSLSRSTQTSLSLPGVKQVVLRSDGVHWVNSENSFPTRSPDEVTHLVEYETSLRVCEQIGDNNNEEFSEGESLICETEVLLEVGENSDFEHCDSI
uniref:Potassium channel domain-containing protein n=1 Tax=Caenorhabditis japonica TaxID=281687 RepID=A0A8R1HXS7_CAEJA